MKTIQQHFKQGSFMLSLLILIQGCTVYKSAQITLEQAAKEEQKVKVITKNNQKLKFEYIRFDNGQYYGVTRGKNIISQIPLEENMVKEVRLNDKTYTSILVMFVTFTGLLSLIVHDSLR